LAIAAAFSSSSSASPLRFTVETQPRLKRTRVTAAPRPLSTFSFRSSPTTMSPGSTKSSFDAESSAAPARTSAGLSTL